MTSIELFEPKGVLPPRGHYSHAVRHGDLVFVSGQLPIYPDSRIRPELCFERQLLLVLRNLSASLEAAGAGLETTLKVTAYLVGMDHWPRFNRLYARKFGVHRPARVAVPVPELHYGFLVELEAVAVTRAAAAGTIGGNKQARG
jgi:2-iminobutanoate/2-iminopropanoate deaminase